MVAVAPGSLRDAGLLTAGEDASLLETAALGLIPPDQQKTWVQTGAVLQSSHSYSGLLSAQLYERASSIGLTVEQIPTYQAEGVVTGTFIIIVFRRLSVQRAVYFWNMRALSNRFGWDPDRVVILPPQALQESEVIERLRVFLERKQRTSPNVIVIAEDSAKARALATSAGLTEPADKKFKRRFGGREGTDAFDPFTFLPNLHPAGFLMGKRREGMTRDVPIAVTRPRSTLYVRSPTDFNFSINGRLRLDVRRVSAWTWPRSNEVAKLIDRDAVAIDEGFSLVTSPNPIFQREFGVPEPQDVCTAFLRERAWAWSHSDKGR